MKHQILIGFEPGSDYQEELGLRELEPILTAWKFHVENAHKKNIVEVVFTETEHWTGAKTDDNTCATCGEKFDVPVKPCKK